MINIKHGEKTWDSSPSHHEIVPEMLGLTISAGSTIPFDGKMS